MESLGRFPRVLNVLPREKIEGPPRDFLKANPRIENPEGSLQYSSEGEHRVLKVPPQGSIHPDTSKAFPQIFILFT